MPGFLFQDVIFGPVRSRRLGLSLGINLLPEHLKYCSFNCIYCECGWTPEIKGITGELPSRDEVAQFLERRLRELVTEDYLPDAITFAGNGEPTLHPEFPGIVEDTIRLRDTIAPEAKVSVLSNSSTLSDPAIFGALERLDNNILKLDAGSEKIFLAMNNPVNPVGFKDMVENLKRFNGRVIIQSMFTRGIYHDVRIDNTTGEETGLWISHLEYIRPSMVMLYSIARATPAQNLEKIGTFELGAIAGRVRERGIEAKIYP
jgi:wyosine [tRNA(Phe)-imidazoG37] synthetase (radical SAM superfamily)